MRTRTKFSPETIDKIRTSYDAGQTVSQTARETGLNRATINNFFVAWNGGYTTRTQYLNDNAKKRGFEDHKMRYAIRNLLDELPPEIFPRAQNVEKLTENFISDELPQDLLPHLARENEYFDKTHNEEEEKISEALRILEEESPRYAELLRRKFFDRMSLTEISSIERVTPGAIRSREKTALKKLRQIYENQMDKIAIKKV